MYKIKTLLLSLLLFSLGQLKAQTPVALNQLLKQVNQTVTVCDSVYSIRVLPKITFMNIGGHYPNQALTLVLYKNDATPWRTLEQSYLHKKICVTGKLVLYKDQPQMIIRDAKELVLK